MKIVWQFRHANIKKLVAVCLSTLLQNLYNNNNNYYYYYYNKERSAAATGLQQFWTLCTDCTVQYLYQRWLKCKECLKWTTSLCLNLVLLRVWWFLELCCLSCNGLDYKTSSTVILHLEKMMNFESYIINTISINQIIQNKCVFLSIKVKAFQWVPVEKKISIY